VTRSDGVRGWFDQNPRAADRGWLTARLGLFTLISIRLTFPHLSKFATHLPGNPGDAFLVFSLLRWGADRSTSLYAGYWNGPMFSSGSDAMAYTETFLPLTPPFRLIESITGSPIVAMNVLYLAAWVLCAECTYLLLRHLTSCRSASFVGALAFTFATIRLAQTGHYQLVFAFCIPLGFLLMFELIERPTLWLGACLGAVLSCQFLTTAYYGLVLIVSVAAAAVVALVRKRRTPSLRPLLYALMVSCAVLVVFVLPVAVRYSSIQSSTHLRDRYPAEFALRLGDLRAADPRSAHLNDFGLFRSTSLLRSEENYAYLGYFVFLFVPVACIGMVVSQRFRSSIAGQRWSYGALIASGLLGFAIAIGRGPIAGVHIPFYDIVKSVIPGVKSMLAIVRVFVFAQLALATVATVGLVWLLGRVPSRVARAAACAALAAVIVVESATTIPIVRVPRVQQGSAADIVDHLDSGVVAELPIAPRQLGATYAYLEATRMLLSSDDGNQTVDGYSGFAPTDYDSVVQLLNALPSAEALAELRRLDVHYLVLYTQPLDTGSDRISDMVNESGYAFMTPAHADQIVAGIPGDLLERTIPADDGLVLVLTPQS
jgi:hypothetical protein